jgi:ElaB/YqjD/DUF883 family membrane-anchored ribosome-binding protein
METGHLDGASGIDAVVPKLIQKARSADEKVVALVRERPLVALGAALAIGYVIGRVISRVG